MLCFGATRYHSQHYRPRAHATRSHPLTPAPIQVEYLVVTHSKDDPRVLLSLRQADILEALASDTNLAAKGGCVPALQDVAGAR